MKKPTPPPGNSQGLSRRTFLGGAAAASTLAALDVHAQPSPSNAARAPAPAPHAGSFELEEVTVSELQSAMESGRHTAHGLAERYLARIQELDRKGDLPLRSVIELNPDALAIAKALDEERKAKGPRGPLHGIPVLIKDNIGTADKMQTTAGSLALVGAVPSREAFIVERLRAAGAVILGKTNLSEWANFRSTHSSSGWSGRGGQCRNPYALDRTPSGSSSGSGAATAANFCAVSVGTETDGSIVSPSAACSLVGLKPTLGLVSRSGIIPISHSQDTAGPMTRTVADAAALLGVLAGIDPADAVTASSKGHAHGGLHALPRPERAEGRAHRRPARALLRLPPRHRRAHRAGAGADEGPGRRHRRCGQPPHAAKLDEPEMEVLLYEFKADIEAYLAGLGDRTPAEDARGPHPLQRGAPRHRAALVRPGALPPGAGEGAAHRQEVPQGARGLPEAVARAGHRRRDGEAQARCARGARPRRRRGSSTW